MALEMIPKLKRSLIKHEGYKNFIYTDSMGKLTGGIGYNFSERGLSDEWINNQFFQDVTYFYNQFINNFPWFNSLNSDRQVALIDMAFMGWKRFLEFEKMIDALSKGDFKTASDEMLNSEWAQQVKEGRATDLADAILKGEYTI